MTGSDAGLRTVDDIFTNLQIDEEWSRREGRGFTWWAHRFGESDLRQAVHLKAS